MKNRRGFTLVELLAVIVILAVIALIAVPMFLRVIENSRKSTFVETSRNFAKNLELHIMKNQSKGDSSIPLPGSGQYVVYNIKNIPDMKNSDNMYGYILITNSGKSAYNYYLFTSNKTYRICGVKVEDATADKVEKQKYCTNIIDDDFNTFTFQELYGDEIDNFPAPTYTLSKDINTYDENPVTINITYAADAIRKEYKYDGDENWSTYSGAITVNENKVLYARAGYTEGESKNVKIDISNIVPIGYIAIYDTATLNAVRDDVTKNYMVVKDFTVEGEFEPLPVFDKIFDGNNRTINGLTITKPTVTKVGLFSETSANAVIKNINLTNVNISGSASVGALVGQSAGNVDNISVTGNIHCGYYYCGGVVGYLDNNIVNNARSDVTVVAQQSMVGGIVGYASGANNYKITKCYVTGDINGPLAVGGILGYSAAKGTVDQNISFANVTATTDSAGGIVGQAFTTNGTINITNSFSGGTINGPTKVGGVVGYAQTSGASTYNGTIVIKNTYSFATVPTTGTGTIGSHYAAIYGKFTIGENYHIPELTGYNSGEKIAFANAAKQNSYTGFAFGPTNPIWKIDEGTSMPYLISLPKPEQVNISYYD